MHRRTASKVIVTDGRLLGEIDQTRNMLRQAKMAEQFNTRGLADEAPRLERQLVELSQQAAEEALTVTVQALPAEEFDDIARQHPPSSDQLQRWREQAKVFPMAEMPEWNSQTMAPDLVKACLVEPEWSAAWWKGLSRGTQTQLWNLALSVQVAGADLPFFNAATATTGDGGEPSTMPANGASPSPNI